jgi:hypothetical protein
VDGWGSYICGCISELRIDQPGTMVCSVRRSWEAVDTTAGEERARVIFCSQAGRAAPRCGRLLEGRCSMDIVCGGLVQLRVPGDGCSILSTFVILLLLSWSVVEREQGADLTGRA